jgi:hypothetical protein
MSFFLWFDRRVRRLDLMFPPCTPTLAQHFPHNYIVERFSL